MKKVLAVLLAAVLMFSMFACGETNGDKPSTDEPGQTTTTTVKAGFIFLHDENSTYDLNFLNAAKEACNDLGIEYILKTNVGEDSACYEAALDLIDHGCNFIFADSFGHEDFVIQAAKENPDVVFAHATGTKAHTEGLKNYHNAFASIYEGRYAAGYMAGMKMQEEINAGKYSENEALVGYVGAFTYAEVISGYTSFFLGLRSACPSAKMQVQFTGSWYDETGEKEAATTLLNNGCKLISQHADSMGAPTACETAGVTNVSYNGSTLSACPNTFLISSRINWAPYFKYVIEKIQNNEKDTIAADWSAGFSEGSVVLSELNETAAAAGSSEKLAEVLAGLKDGSIKVFDTSTFTITVAENLNDNIKTDADGHVTSYKADVDTDEAYAGDTEVIKDGVFQESLFRSAPYFDLKIDGIELLNVEF